ncbi:unnamed protein product, partial [Nesidiocoris tenuis]
MNGFRNVCPGVECGAIMYIMEKIGNIKPMRMICKACRTIFFRRKPGRPSYHIEASSCWTFG